MFPLTYLIKIEGGGGGGETAKAAEGGDGGMDYTTVKRQTAGGD